jgi:5,10-methylenetetrahydrofolate reductase
MGHHSDDDEEHRGLEPVTTLEQRLAARGFVATAELGPPIEPDADPIRAAARELLGNVDAVNVTDNQAATVKVSALACSALLIDEGLEPILQVTGRDRNIMAVQSDLLGAWALGIRSVLALSGDPLKVGLYDGIATHVLDLDSLRLSALIREMNDGRLAAGETLTRPPAFTIAGAANPLVDSAARLEAKLQSGVTLFQTNIVYDVGRFAAWLGPLHDQGLTERAPFLIGVTPPRSTRMLRHMHDNIPGVEVDDATFARLEGLDGQAAKDEGIRVAAELVERLREIPGVAGIHLMAPGWETEAVPAIVERSGLRA